MCRIPQRVRCRPFHGRLRRQYETVYEVNRGRRLGARPVPVTLDPRRSDVQFRCAARHVRSRVPATLVEVGDSRFLVDCGMHQGGDKELPSTSSRSPSIPGRSTSSCSPTRISTTRAGLPRLVKQGFSEAHIRHSGHLRPGGDHAARLGVHPGDGGRVADPQSAARGPQSGSEPLYDQDDARRAIALLKPVEYSTAHPARSRRDGHLPRRRPHPGLGLSRLGAGRGRREGQGPLQR